MVMEEKHEPIHISIRVYDKKNNFIAYLSNIVNVHKCSNDIAENIKRIYQYWLDSNVSQVYTRCNIFFVYPSRVGIDYAEWGKQLDISAKKFEPLKKTILTTLFESFGDGIVRKYNNSNIV